MSRLSALLLLAALAGCASDASSPPPPAKKAPPRHTWDDDEIQKIDFPEATTNPTKDDAKPAKPAEPARPVVKIALSVYDVISWDDVKIRGGARGSAIRGVVSLTGWLAKAKSAARTDAQVQVGREAALDVAEDLRELVGGTVTFKVAVLDASEKGELDITVTPVATATDEATVAPATRIKLSPGEALVVGGHRTEDGDEKKAKDRLVLIEASR